MARKITTISLDQNIKQYAKMAARRSGFSFVDYYEDLMLKDLRDNHEDFFKLYLKEIDVETTTNDSPEKLTLSRAIEAGLEIKDSNGNVIIAAKNLIEEGEF